MRAGWLLLLLQPVAIAVVAVLAAAFIDGTRWLVVFVPLVLLFVVWLWQARDAYKRALRAGYEPTGEWAIVALLPVMVTALTVFWLVGGRHGSPSATLQAYADAWISDRPDVAGQLFVVPRAPQDMDRMWEAERSAVVQRIAGARAIYGPESGLDPARPFDSLRFREVPQTDGRVAMVGEIVRSRRAQATLLGFIPTAGQETVVVEPAVTLWLSLEPLSAAGWLSFLPLESNVWKIDTIDDPDGV